MVAPSKCHTDVGAQYGSRGFLDFCIDDKQRWGYELLRGGNRVQEHLQRFDPAIGRYRYIPLADYAVVDFYETDTNVDVCDDKYEKYYKAVFSADFKVVQLFHNGAMEEINCGKTE